MAALQYETVIGQDAYRGVLWLRENQDKFKSRVHEPIMLCLNLVKSEYARYVETHVGRADLEGFVCEVGNILYKCTVLSYILLSRNLSSFWT